MESSIDNPRLQFTRPGRSLPAVAGSDRGGSFWFAASAAAAMNHPRTLAGFHFRNSCEEGSNLGRYVVRNYFRPVH